MVCMQVHMHSGWTFGAVLIAFFLSSSQVRSDGAVCNSRLARPDQLVVVQLTRLKQGKKAELDESFKLEGHRGLTQVITRLHKCASADTIWLAAVDIKDMWLRTSLEPLMQYACCPQWHVTPPDCRCCATALGVLWQLYWQLLHLFLARMGTKPSCSC